MAVEQVAKRKSSSKRFLAIKLYFYPSSQFLSFLKVKPRCLAVTALWNQFFPFDLLSVPLVLSVFISYFWGFSLCSASRSATSFSTKEKREVMNFFWSLSEKLALKWKTGILLFGRRLSVRGLPLLAETELLSQGADAVVRILTIGWTQALNEKAFIALRHKLVLPCLK